MKSSEHVAIILVLTNMIERKELKVDNTMDLIMDVIDIIRKSKLKFSDVQTMDLARQFITEIAKGKDGQLGTMDDLIPAKTLNEIDEIMSTSIFSDVLVICNDLIKLRRVNLRRSFICMSKMCMKH